MNKIITFFGIVVLVVLSFLAGYVSRHPTEVEEPIIHLYGNNISVNYYKETNIIKIVDHDEFPAIECEDKEPIIAGRRYNLSEIMECNNSNVRVIEYRSLGGNTRIYGAEYNNYTNYAENSVLFGEQDALVSKSEVEE